MAATTMPADLLDVFREPALGNLAYLNARGQLVAFPMWVDYDGAHVLTSSAVGSRKGKSLRERPQVAVLIVSTTDPWHWLSVSGRVVRIEPDENLAFIDRMSQKYTGQPYQRRTPREIFTIEIDRVNNVPWG